jgi:hypothetical protein
MARAAGSRGGSAAGQQFSPSMRVADFHRLKTTIMWFDDLAAVKRFMGDDYEVSHVPAVARAVLARFDEQSAHYDVLDRRSQGGG